MELHLLNLYKLCRICGGIVVTKRGYVNAKTCSDCVDLLITCFGILPSEDKEVYRQRLFIICKHRLDKITKDSTNLVQEVPAYFQPHLETDCNICNISIAKHRKLTNSHIKLFDKEFSNHQFCRYNQGASRYLFYYKPVISKSKVYVPLALAIRDDLTWSVCVTEGIEISPNHG